MSRRRGRKQRADVNDARTSEEKEQEDVAAIDERRLGGDPASSMGLSSLLFSHQKIYLQPTQISTKLDGTMGFYIHLDHFPDDFKKITATTTLSAESVEPAAAAAAAETAAAAEAANTAKTQPIGFVRSRVRFNPVSACLKNEIKVLQEKVNDLDEIFQRIKINIELDSESMTESEKAEQGFKMRDLSREIQVEKSSIESLREKLEIEEDRGIAVVYSTADTEGRKLTMNEVLDGFVSFFSFISQ